MRNYLLCLIGIGAVIALALASGKDDPLYGEVKPSPARDQATSSASADYNQAEIFSNSKTIAKNLAETLRNGGLSSWVKTVKTDPLSPGKVFVVVRNDWIEAEYHERLQFAQLVSNLLLQMVTKGKGGEPMGWPFTIVDQFNNEWGGNSLFGGARVKERPR